VSFSPGEITQILIALLGFGGVLWRFRRVDAKVEEIHVATNSMKDALVDGPMCRGRVTRGKRLVLLSPHPRGRPRTQVGWPRTHE
jgi:hypothetical protein